MLFLGGLLFVYQWQGPEVLNWLVAWWPLVFILLGVEILCWIVLQNKNQSIVLYDVLSILFIGFLGSVCIGLTLLSSTGVLAEVRQAVGAVAYSQDLPVTRLPIDSSVKRIVVETGDQPLTIEGTNSREVHLFGQVHTTTALHEKGVAWRPEDIASLHAAGDSLFISIRPLPHKAGVLGGQPRADLTLLLPNDLPVEIDGRRYSLDVRPGDLKSNWLVKNGGFVSLILPRQGNLFVTAVMDRNRPSGNTPWDSLETLRPAVEPVVEGSEVGPRVYGAEKIKGSLKIGGGTHQLQILDSIETEVNLVAGV